jgi:hypothetical protein
MLVRIYIRVKIKVIAVMVRLGRVVKTTLIVTRRCPIGLV